jgi:esterase/lipase superfamily enzyme
VTKTVSSWHSPRLRHDITLARWGHYGRPVLLFPTAGGDAEEIERMQMIHVLQPLLEAGRIKVYSCDSLAGRWLAARWGSVEHRCWLLNQFEEYIACEVVPAIRTDCRAAEIEVITAGASIGAFKAVAVLCRYPWLFSAAVAMSPTFDLEGLLGFRGTEDYYYSAPMCFVPNLGSGPLLEMLQRRFVLIAHGQGCWENPEESWRMARVLGAKGVPNRVDAWSHDHDHDWSTWRQMLPGYLDALVP